MDTCFRRRIAESSQPVAWRISHPAQVQDAHSFRAAALTGFDLEVVIAFGTAALLYLVTEELLVETHETPDTPLLTAMFFAGFLVLIIIEMVTS